MRILPRTFAGILTLLVPVAAGAAQIEGDYIEARTADVYTGPCFSNSEIFITGHQAVMAWNVRQGSWDGVDLAGLAVAAAVRGTTTFSQDDPSRARSVLIVDERADARQRAALVAMARHLGGERLTDVVAIETAPMSLKVAAPGEAESCHDEALTHCHNAPQAPPVTFTAGDLAEIITRPLAEGDHHCGNEVVAYAPLSEGVEVVPAYTTSHVFRGDGLNTRWSDPNCRSSFFGRFAY